MVVDGQRAAGLRFGDPRVQALLSALVVFRLVPNGFANRDLRGLLGPLLGLEPSSLTQGMMSYDLRRLRLHGLIERIPGTHRYVVNDFGLRAALILTRGYARLVRPGLALAIGPPTPGELDRALRQVDLAVDRLTRSGLAA